MRQSKRRCSNVAEYRIAKAATLHAGKRNLLKLTVQLPGGDTMEREVVDGPAAAAVLPYDPERRTVILLRQFRAPVLHAEGIQNLVETIAGLLDGDEEPEACARRETMEEAGLRLDALEPVGVGWSTPGFSTERVHLFLAPYAAADRVAEGGGLADEHEDIEVLEIGLDELASMLERNAIDDLKALALAQALFIRHPRLFEKP
jgi:nudix-type nucleoside diphosphatase (YffH/AdpP family)